MIEYFGYAFFRNALIGVAMLSVVAGVIGTYIVTRRLVAISGGVTHTCFGGLGLGYFLGINPLLVAAIFAIGASLGVEWMSTRQRVREDTAIAVVWALGMALGVLFVFLTPGYVPELNTFLFGNILTITQADLVALGVYLAALGAFYGVMYRKIVICAFDRDFARVSGLPVTFISYAMTVFVAVGIVLAIRLVGVMLLMSMFSLPQLVAETRLRRYGPVMAASTLVALAASVGGLLLSTVVNVPCSALIVLLLVLAYAGAMVYNKAAKRRVLTS